MPYLAALCTAIFRHLKKNQRVASTSQAGSGMNIWIRPPGQKATPQYPQNNSTATKHSSHMSGAIWRGGAIPGLRLVPGQDSRAYSIGAGTFATFRRRNSFFLHFMYHFENSGMYPVHSTSYCAVGNSNYKATKLKWCCWRFDIYMHTAQPVLVGNAFKCMHGIYIQWTDELQKIWGSNYSAI